VIVTVSNWIAMQKLNRMGILNNVDIIHTNINRDLFGNLIARKYNIPHITHLREFSRSHFHLEPIYKNQIAMMNNYTDCFIAISNAVKNDWIDYGINKSKITVIYDGINTKEYQSCHKIIQVKMGLKIVMSGAIYEGKGQYELLLAVGPLIKLGYDISVDYFGSSTNKGYYRQLLTYIEDNGLKKKIHFKGFIENLLDVLSEYDVGVICSKSEGFGLVTIEYMLSGITVIASDTGANPELLCNGEYGYLYPLGNVNELRRIIKELYDNEINRNSKENNTINYVKEKFSIEKTANDVMKLYSDILDKV
jgi:glycosyltransferase involved in cell wall biosynthesis